MSDENKTPTSTTVEKHTDTKVTQSPAQRPDSNNQQQSNNQSQQKPQSDKQGGE